MMEDGNQFPESSVAHKLYEALDAFAGGVAVPAVIAVVPPPTENSAHTEPAASSGDPAPDDTNANSAEQDLKTGALFNLLVHLIGFSPQAATAALRLYAAHQELHRNCTCQINVRADGTLSFRPTPQLPAAPKKRTDATDESPQHHRSVSSVSAQDVQCLHVTDPELLAFYAKHPELSCLRCFLESRKRDAEAPAASQTRNKRRKSAKEKEEEEACLL